MTSEKLKKLGLNDQKIKETLKNETLSSKLASASDSLPEDPAKNMCTLTYNLVTKSKSDSHVGLLLPLILNGNIQLDCQLEAGLKFLQKTLEADVTSESLSKASGVGLIASDETIKNVVAEAINKNNQEIVANRYKFPVGKLLGAIRNDPKLKFCDTKMIKTFVDDAILQLLGPKTDEDNKKDKVKVKSKPQKPKEAQTKSADVETLEEQKFDSIEELIRGSAMKLHRPGGNAATDGYVTTKHTESLIKDHLTRTGGMVKTRFPPEPNGILHIGHAKAINFNFGYAKAYNGTCNLRYDDTNPEKEEEIFFRGIREDVEWLGYTPSAVLHASDYFDQLYQWAIELIQHGLAYVCHQQAEDLKGHDSPDSPWRNRPISESLSLFKDMKNGKFEEGQLSLRMKHIMEDGKKDPVAYRIKYTEHAKSGDKWCIYPTYDFTHCLSDSIEDISHSLCTKEFQARRSSYYWVCNSLNVYCPVQWEYGRLNLQYTVVSKRKIKKLIDNKVVGDWDDPRLFTLSALRRRGIPPEAVNLFCARVGVTMAQVMLEPSMLDSVCREVLNKTCLRVMCVVEPLKVNITNFNQFDKNSLSNIKVKNHPDIDSMGDHQISISNKVFIEKSDFIKQTSDKGYKRLSSTQPVALKYAGLILKYVDSVSENEINVVAEKLTSENKPKGFIHWVDGNSCMNVRINSYSQLFKSKDPEGALGGFVNDVNRDSLEVLKNCVIDRHFQASIDENLRSTRESEYKPFPFLRAQFERTGYFCLDRVDSKINKVPTFNKTIGLKDSR